MQPGISAIDWGGVFRKLPNSMRRRSEHDRGILGFYVERRQSMMEQPRGRTVAREPVPGRRALWSMLDAAATPVSTLATLAALVRALSPSDYGILVIALAASGLSMAINPAIAATTTKFVSELSGGPHPGGRTVAGVITVSLVTVTVIDLVLVLGTAVFSERLSLWAFGLRRHVARDRHVGELLLLAVLSIGIQQIEAVLAAALRGLERFRRQALIELLSRGGARYRSDLCCLAYPISGGDFGRAMRGLPGVNAGARRCASPAAAGQAAV